MILLALLLELLSVAPAEQPLRVHIRAGVETHGPNQHDHPRFLSEWGELLEERGASVTSTMQFPGPDVLEDTDVLVLYAAEGATIHGDERIDLERFLSRGGGLVAIHDAVCGDDPAWFKGIAGGAWEHGHSKYLEGDVGLYIADREHPITAGAQNFDLDDEIYYDLHLDPRAQVLVNSFHTPFDVRPQMWTFEGRKHRAFVALQGHEFATFSHPAWRTLLLRGIAWAGGREVDLLTQTEEAASLAYPLGGATRPQRAHETFQLNEEFEINLVAAEPLVVNPISLDWDERGRLWVACTPGYPYKEEFKGVPAHDEVVILSDGDDDGRLEQRTVFHSGLDLVTTLVRFGDGVIVGQAPDILYLRDTDGDDRADVIEPLYSGFGYADTHATISNFRLGLDGWIYGTQGYSGGASRHVLAHGDGGRDCGAIGNGLFRFRPDGTAIERVSSYGSNTWGLDFSWDGELFFTMANASHLRHLVLEESVLSRGRLEGVASWRACADHERAFPVSQHQRPPYVQIDVVGGFTAAAGCLIYGGGAWPEDYTGNHFVSEPTLNLVHRDLVVGEGSSYRGRKPRKEEFLAAEDLWFRPVHLRTGPDGAVYLLDFYNQAAVHNDTRNPPHGPTNAALRPDRDHQHGRIWRLQHRKARQMPRPDFESAAGLLAALDHPNRQTRMVAQRLMGGGGPSGGGGPAGGKWGIGRQLQAGLVSLARAGSPAGRVQALWLLHHHGGVPEDVLLAALASPQAGVRKNAARLAGLGTVDRFLSRRSPKSGAATRQMLPALLEDVDGRVCLEAAAALGRQGAPAQARPHLVRIFGSSSDPWLRSALLGACLLEPAEYLELALAAGQQDLARELARRSGRRSDHALAVLLRLARLEDHDPRSRAQLLAALAENLGERPPPWTSALAEALAGLVNHRDIELALAAMPIARAWDLSGDLEIDGDDQARRLLERAGDQSAEIAGRLLALRLLLRAAGYGANAASSVADLLTVRHSPAVHLKVIEAIGEGAADPALQVLVDAWPGLGGEARAHAFRRLCERGAGAQALLAAVEAGDIPVGDLGPRRRHVLENFGEGGVAQRARALFANDVSGASEEALGALIEEWTEYVSLPGDGSVGRELFILNCGNCHTFADQAGETVSDGEVGPVLTGMGAHGPAELLPLILNPNASVEEAYVEYMVRTDEGRTIGGVLARDGAESILIRHADGEDEIFRDEIEELASTGRSPMPTGFESLEKSGLRDLLTFMCGAEQQYRLLDISASSTANTEAGLYDPSETTTLTFDKYGITECAGIPFEVLDPSRSLSGNNAIVLKGGMTQAWATWHAMPAAVEIPVGFELKRVHVLGGVAAWGFPCRRDGQVAASWRWNYADGSTETVELRDGDVFADWIAAIDVPGSVSAEGVLAADSRGQLRRFSLAPSRAGVIESITLSSPPNHIAPTFLALTASLVADDALPPDAARPVFNGAPDVSLELSAVDVLLVGGGSSHDYGRWFDREDRASLEGHGLGRTLYTERVASLAQLPPTIGALVLSNNQPLSSAEQRAGLFDHVARGGGLLLLHPATWYNWPDWPQYNSELVGGGARGHEAYGEFEVRVVDHEHPVTAGLPAVFTVRDELYRFEADLNGAPIEVLAVGRSRSTTDEFPVLWTVDRPKGRTVCTTLGHDGVTHQHPAWKALLRASLEWVR
ncbi:MAG: ThuA domain-containing protein [Planctomycetota bacterium]|nr:ThuA domain-containing protein [Planctomycetota bacterium]